MPKPEWGKKRTCQSCGAVFYDLRRKTIECPKCGAAYNPEPPIKGKRAVAPVAAQAPAPKPAAAKFVAPVPPGVDPDLADDDEADDDDSPVPVLAAAKKGDDGEKELIEDASDLGEDEDDIGEVKEHIDDGVGDKA